MKSRLIKSYIFRNGFIGLILIVVLSLLMNPTTRPDQPELRAAAENMEQSLAVIKEYCLQHQINVNNPEDPGHTGLIGPEWSELATTIGDPEAKRSTINPNFAALIVHLLKEAGVKRGDTIAIGSSGSFPALLIASLSAAKAMKVYPVVIFSFGSSSFGASNPDFNIWDMYRLLLENHVTDIWPVAASFGGEDDTGSEFEPALTDRLRSSLREAGIPLISETDLRKNVAIREQYYFADFRPTDVSFENFTDEPPPPLIHHSIKAFINSGGGYANLGSSPAVLSLKPGLVNNARIPEPAEQGMIHEMLIRHIPVIHLLYIKGLARKYNLPWDPVLQPAITRQSLQFETDRRPVVLLISLAGLCWFLLFLIRYRMLFNNR